MVPVSLCCQFAFVMNGLCLQADTTDTEYRQPGGGIHQDFHHMDFLDGPEARQRAQSIASVITSTVEGRYCTP